MPCFTSLLYDFNLSWKRKRNIRFFFDFYFGDFEVFFSFSIPGHLTKKRYQPTRKTKKHGIRAPKVAQKGSDLARQSGPELASSWARPDLAASPIRKNDKKTLKIEKKTVPESRGQVSQQKTKKKTVDSALLAPVAVTAKDLLNQADSVAKLLICSVV